MSTFVYERKAEYQLAKNFKVEVFMDWFRGLNDKTTNQIK